MLPTVMRPTKRVPAMDALMTGMCSASSASKTLHEKRREDYSLVCVSGSDGRWKNKNILKRSRARLKLTALNAYIPVKVFCCTESDDAICICQVREHSNFITAGMRK